MSKLLALVVFVVLNATSLGQKGPNNHHLNSSCPTWTIYDNSTNSCKCGGRMHNIVFCTHIDGCTTGFNVVVVRGFCMTLNKDQTKAVVGSCPFRLKALHQIVPRNTSQLDQAVCGYINRTGQLCGQCLDGTSPPVYSYTPWCVNCSTGTNNWAKYLAVSRLPTTLFFIGAIVIKLRAASPRMNCYILLCQIIASPSILRHLVARNSECHYRSDIWGILVVNVWNLDFFRIVYTPFCLHPNASMLEVLSLDYITAAYPLALIVLTYTLVTLHYYNCRLLVWLSRPFLRCCIRFQRQLDIRNSLVDAFATFLLLSYVKFLSVSFDILTPTISWDSTGERQPTMLYYNGTVEYLSKEHLPYAFLAVTVLLVFTLLPILLLCLYPCHCFQRFLNSCHLRRQALHTFMDAFQGCYKDGTNGTRDCRYFAALYLVTQVAVHLSLILSSLTFTILVLFTVVAVLILLLLCFNPYKTKFCNQLDIFFLLILIVFISSAWIIQDDTINIDEKEGGRVVFAILALILIMYPLCLMLYHIWRKSGRLQSATERIRAFFSRTEPYHDWAESLPRRVPMDETSHLLKGERQHKS